MGLIKKDKVQSGHSDLYAKLQELRKRHERLNRMLEEKLSQSLSDKELKKMRKKVEELAQIDEEIKELEKIERTQVIKSLINSSR